MNPQRITAQSKANIKAADRAELVASSGDQMVKVWKEGKAAFICGKEGPMLYPTANDARRAIKRIRPELELTSFNCQGVPPRHPMRSKRAEKALDCW